MLDARYGKVEKVRVKAQIVTIDGVGRTGQIFLHPNERIIDMMNDGRTFIAFEADAGFEVVSKHVIATVRQLRQFRCERDAHDGATATELVGKSQSNSVSTGN